MASCNVGHDILLALVAGAIGFFSSYAQWKLGLKQQQKEETRKQIKRLIFLLGSYSNWVSDFVNKRNPENFYTGEAGENPMPEIVWLKDLHAPEIDPQVAKMKETFSVNFPLVMIEPKNMQPIHDAVNTAKGILKTKLEAFR
jgi:hypothetical protein